MPIEDELQERRNDFDVTNTVQVSSPPKVRAAVAELLSRLYPQSSFDSVWLAFHDFDRLFSGNHPEYHAVDTSYHDIQHTLDVSKTTLQGLTSLGGVVLVVATLPFAWLADRYMRTRILAAATLVWSVFMMLTGAVGAPWQMGLARAGAGFGASARIPISPSAGSPSS